MEDWYRCPGCAVLSQCDDGGELDECPVCGTAMSKDDIEKAIIVPR